MGVIVIPSEITITTYVVLHISIFIKKVNLINTLSCFPNEKYLCYIQVNIG